MGTPVKKTTEYLIAAAAVAAVSFIVIIIAGISLSQMSVPYDDPTVSEQLLVERTAEVTGVSGGTRTALYRIGSGYYSAGDYVVRGLTSPDYLTGGGDDSKFASDLVTITSGVANTDTASVLEDLGDKSRMYVVNDTLKAGGSYLEATGKISSDSGDSFSDCTVTRSLEGDGGVTFGIRTVEGSFITTGSEMRTDFFVDGVFCQGNIKIEDSEDNSGAKNFLMSWNSDGISAGDHDVQILLRSSDGRGAIIAGGSIYVPEFMTLVNNNVQPGTLAADKSEVWYSLDAKDNNAYVNFVGLSGDIKVSIYDAYGSFLGSNDNEGTAIEVLRGEIQDVQAISEETGLSVVANKFFIKVERSDRVQDTSDASDASDVQEASAITYTMIQSREAATYDGSYVSVVDSVGAVPTPLPVTGNLSEYSGEQITVQDMNNNVYTVDYEDLNYLPINGFLSELSIGATGTGMPIGMFPEFESGTVNYGLYDTEDPGANVLNYESVEGMFSTVSAVLSNFSGDTAVGNGSELNFAPGENKLSITVTSFDGQSKSYTVYVLIGNDSGGFAEGTLSQFPESYGSGLWLLHSLHPNYIFTPYNTGLNFYTVLDNEDSGSRSLANMYSHPLWVDSSSVEYDGGGWKAATSEVVRYFLDPRNYLDQEHIFTFELLSFDENVQTVEGVKAMISGTFMDTDEYDYAQIIYEAGRNAGVSPYLLASRIIQEMGSAGQSALCTGTLEGYEGYYNFYNIGSTPDTSVENGALINGAKYAKWGSDPDSETITEDEAALLLPWDSVEDAIKGGALWIAQSYISIGQDTLYFQKFDVINNNDGLYYHQYAQNISMAYTEAERYFSSYADCNMLDGTLEFVIPVYTSMPDTYGEMPDAY